MTINMFWIKNLYIHLLHRLREIIKTCDSEEELNSILFNKYMKKFIELGGNVTVNASVLGSLLGSIIGFNKLPRDYLSTVMKVNCPESKHPRPKCFEPISGFINLMKLINSFMKI